ncbi:MAG: amino acid ABC transporter substrate-binding protein [Myxococcales bacterium]
MRYPTIACAVFLVATGCATTKSGSSGSGDTLDKIKSSKVVKLGYRDSSVPFSSVGHDGNPMGYSIDLCTAVVDGLSKDLELPDLKIEWVKVTPESRIDAVVNGTIDLECGSTTSTLARQERVDFSFFTFLDGATVMSSADASVHKLGDLSGKKIAVIAGTTTEKLLREAFVKAGITPEIVVVKEHRDGLVAINEKRVDAYASDRVILLSLALNSSEPHKYTMVDRLLSYEPYGLMLRRDPSFRLAVNRQLARIYRSGSVIDIYGKWFGNFGPPSEILLTMYAMYALPE